MQTKILKPTQDNMQLCAKAILDGRLVAFPTETVYGLGANAFDAAAVRNIYEAKGRPSDNPLIVHLGDKKNISSFAEINDKAKRLMDKFMPGPLTLLLKKRSCISDVVTAGRATVGIRVPQNQVAQEFLRLCNVPVCAPSANTSSRPSPTAAVHVLDDLRGRIEYILDGGNCDIGIESTIVDVSGENILLLRKGGISPQTLENVLGEAVIVADSGSEALSPGLKYRHYSPKAKVILVRAGKDLQKIIKKIYKQQIDLYKKTVVLCYNNSMGLFVGCDCIGMGDSAEEFAHNLYGTFRNCDKDGFDTIICEGPEETGMGLALYNRIFKAAGGEFYANDKV